MSTKKEDIQGIVDRMVEDYKERTERDKTVSTYMGVPLREFSVDELIAIIDEAGFTAYIERRNSL